MARKLNTTGSCWVDSNGNYYSYNQQMTVRYKGVNLFDDGFYSMTTRKHQAIIRDYFNVDMDLKYVNFNHEDIERELKSEIKYTLSEIKSLEDKRNTQKKKDTIERLQNKIDKITELLNK